MTTTASSLAGTPPGVAARAAEGAPGWRLGCYGALQAALNFVALPLYVFLPAYYAAAQSVPLALLGGVLLASRLGDAAVDPLLGRLADRMLARQRARACIAVAGGVLLAGFLALMALPALLDYAAHPGLFSSLLLLALLLTYGGFSAASVIHQAWGSTLGQDERARTRVFAWREALGLAGVLLAAAAAQFGGARAFSLGLLATLGLSLGLLRLAPDPARSALHGASLRGLRAACEPLRHAAFRHLLLVYTLNGVAAAIPATLVLFFIRDRIGAPALSGLFLALYFASAAAGAPLWVRAVGRLGAARCWIAGMLATVGTFLFAALLRHGDGLGYALVCAASGLCLGADLVLPPALLAGLIARLGHSGSLEGAYFGWWSLCTKLALALAAGIALPLLGLLGYTPGTPAKGLLPPLVIAYCLLPSTLKALSAALFRRGWREHGPATATP